ncbi:hypothetical protein T265_01919 [Opisthorchis viverrini]|uniref:Uncharacterized protein n=1 Tax=Opisthorchis viverrini TaxID=6198 RepID=A0A074ZY27_OPIVI|nr:hypothetical protein T265_01919 [Opisthorchis viverrini]KER31991.1 hypothetical protein T265_01919 [Opisthorchis viverrini]
MRIFQTPKFFRMANVYRMLILYDSPLHGDVLKIQVFGVAGVFILYFGLLNDVSSWSGTGRSFQRFECKLGIRVHAQNSSQHLKY